MLSFVSTSTIPYMACRLKLEIIWFNNGSMRSYKKPKTTALIIFSLFSRGEARHITSRVPFPISFRSSPESFRLWSEGKRPLLTLNISATFWLNRLKLRIMIIHSNAFHFNLKSNKVKFHYIRPLTIIRGGRSEELSLRRTIVLV